jgi:hypothetical protein
MAKLHEASAVHVENMRTNNGCAGGGHEGQPCNRQLAWLLPARHAQRRAAKEGLGFRVADGSPLLRKKVSVDRPGQGQRRLRAAAKDPQAAVVHSQR